MAALPISNFYWPLLVQAPPSPLVISHRISPTLSCDFSPLCEFFLFLQLPLQLDNHPDLLLVDRLPVGVGGVGRVVDQGGGGEGGLDGLQEQDMRIRKNVGYKTKLGDKFHRPASVPQPCPVSWGGQK